MNGPFSESRSCVPMATRLRFLQSSEREKERVRFGVVGFLSVISQNVKMLHLQGLPANVLVKFVLQIDEAVVASLG